MHRTEPLFKRLNFRATRSAAFLLAFTCFCSQAFAQPQILRTPGGTNPLPSLIQKRSYSFNSGTGFFVTNGLVVTNEHVVSQCLSVHIRGAVKPTRVQVRYVDKNLDLALLESPVPPARVALLKSAAELLPEQRVTVIGYPLDRGVSGSYLVKSAEILNAHPSSPYILLSDVARKGNSGGPLLDGSGSVVGVIRGMLDSYNYIENTSTGERTFTDHTRASMAIPLITLKRFLDAQRVPYLTESSSHSYPSNWTENIARQFLVNVHCITDVKEE